METVFSPHGTSTGRVIAVYDGTGAWTFESAERRAELASYVIVGKGNVLLEVQEPSRTIWVKTYADYCMVAPPPEERAKKQELLDRAIAGTADRAPWKGDP